MISVNDYIIYLFTKMSLQPPAYTVLPQQQTPTDAFKSLLKAPTKINALADEINKCCMHFRDEVHFRGTGFGGVQPIGVVNMHNDKVAKMLKNLADMLEKYKAGLIAVDDENKSKLIGFNDSNRLEVLFYESCERNTLDTLRANVNQALLSKFESLLRNFKSGLS